VLESLKRWIEGLFRGITRHNALGEQYIARTPTTQDIGLQRLKLLRETWVTAGVADHQTQTWTVPQGEKWLVRKIVSAATTALTSGAFVPFVNLNGGGFYPYGGRSHNVAAAGVMCPSDADFYGVGTCPFMLEQGDQIYLYSYNNPIGTHNFMIYYNRIEV